MPCGCTFLLKGFVFCADFVFSFSSNGGSHGCCLKSPKKTASLRLSRQQQYLACLVLMLGPATAVDNQAKKTDENDNMFIDSPPRAVGWYSSTSAAVTPTETVLREMPHIDLRANGPLVLFEQALAQLQDGDAQALEATEGSANAKEAGLRAENEGLRTRLSQVKLGVGCLSGVQFLHSVLASMRIHPCFDEG